MIKNSLIIVLFLLFCATAFSQKKEDSVAYAKHHKAIFKPLQPEQKFTNDLKANKLNIYLLGGIVSVIKKEDLDFEKKYGINYHDFGCIAPSNFEFYERYNQLVFDYLATQYGKNWIASTNKNAFGFKKWNG